MKDRASKPFVDDDDEFLWIGATGRYFGIRPSILLEIENNLDALDFDRAVALRLARFDQERDEHQAKLIAEAVSKKIFGDGGGEETVDEESE